MDNVRGFLVYGDYRNPNPPAAIVDAVANGEVDVAVVWGTLAGYFAATQAGLLTLAPVEPAMDGPQWPMAFDIAIGVRRGEPEFRSEIEHAMSANQHETEAILAAYHVPLVASPPEEPQAAKP